MVSSFCCQKPPVCSFSSEQSVFPPQFLVYFTFVFTRTDATLEKQRQKANFVHSFRKTTTFTTLSKRTRIAKQILTRVRRNVYPELGCHISAEVRMFSGLASRWRSKTSNISRPELNCFYSWLSLSGNNQPFYLHSTLCQSVYFGHSDIGNR